MRTLKKTLCLVLALVMVLGLCAFGASATDYNDDAQIEHKEAVDVMTSLGIINGMGNNTYAPTERVTRAQMAKMITILTLGDVDTTAFQGTPTTLTDIDGHWAESYIKYCVSQGIVAGRGDGTFDPEGYVTTAEAGKMLLVAIGYNSDVQGYTGEGWDLNVIRDAQKSGFFKETRGLSSDKQLTRDEAAQVIYNAADADMIQATPEWNSATGTTSYSYAPYGDNRDLLSETFKVITKELTADDNPIILLDSKLETAGDHKGEYKVTLDKSATGSTVAGATSFYTTEDYSDLLGQRVVLRFSNDDGDVGKTYNNAKDKVISIAAYSSSATGEFNWVDLDNDGDYKVKTGGTTYSLDKDGIDAYAVAVDGTVTQSIAATATTATTLKAAVGTAGTTDVYSTLRLVDNDNDGTYDAAIISEIEAAKVSYVDGTRVIAGANTYNYDDHVIPSGVKKDDYVAIQYNFAEGKTELTVIDKATGKVTAQKTDNVKIDGSDWLYYTPAAASDVDDTWDYWLLNGAIVDKKVASTADSAENFVFVSNLSSGMNGTEAKVWHVDGTSEVLKVDTSSGAPAAPTVRKFYTMSEVTNGYRFTAADGKNGKDEILSGYTYYDSNTNDINATLSKISDFTPDSDTTKFGIADDAVVFVYCFEDIDDKTFDSYEVKVITGKQLKTLDANDSRASAAEKILGTSAGYMTKTTNGITKVTHAAVEYVNTDDVTTPFNNWNTALGKVGDNYALVTAAPVSVSGGIEYSIWTGSENLTVLDKSSSAGNTAGDVNKFSIIAYGSITSDNEIKDVTSYTLDNTTGYTSGAGKHGAAALTGFEKVKGEYNLYLDRSAIATTTDDDTVYLYIKSDASTADEIGIATAVDFQTADNVGGASGVDYQNVLVYTATANVARVIVVDISNRLATAAATNVSFASSATLGGGNLTVTLNGDAVTTSTELKIGDILVVTNTSGTSGSYKTFSNTTNLRLASDGTTDLKTNDPGSRGPGRIYHGESFSVLVTGTAPDLTNT